MRKKKVNFNRFFADTASEIRDEAQTAAIEEKLGLSVGELCRCKRNDGDGKEKLAKGNIYCHIHDCIILAKRNVVSSPTTRKMISTT